MSKAFNLSAIALCFVVGLCATCEPVPTRAGTDGEIILAEFGPPSAETTALLDESMGIVSRTALDSTREVYRPSYLQGERRIYPPGRVVWLPVHGPDSTLNETCYTTGALIEINCDYILMCQSQWPDSDLLARTIRIYWPSICWAYNYETGAYIEQPDSGEGWQ